MASPQVIDTSARERQLDQFLRQSAREKQGTALSSAKLAKNKVVEDAQTPVGKVVSHTYFQYALQRMNPSLIFEQTKAYPEQGGIYVRDYLANQDDSDPNNRGRRFVTGMCWGMMPENTQWDLNEDKFGEPQPHIVRKGWRDTLKVLIQMRLVTLDAVERAFGAGGKNWHTVLH